jgi:hypothetical protein
MQQVNTSEYQEKHMTKNQETLKKHIVIEGVKVGESEREREAYMGKQRSRRRRKHTGEKTEKST